MKPKGKETELVIRPGTGVDFEVEDGVSALTRTNFFVPIILKRLFDFLVLLVDPLLEVEARLGHCITTKAFFGHFKKKTQANFRKNSSK